MGLDLEELVSVEAVESKWERDTSSRLVVGRLQEGRRLAAGEPDPQAVFLGVRS